MGSRYNERVLGTRIKHQMGEISVKIYDKFGKVLRIEVTASNVSKLNTFRDVFERKGEIGAKSAPVKKNIYSTVKGLNFFNKQDEKILLSIANGKFAINGLRSKNLKEELPGLPVWKISNIIKRIKNLGIIKKVAHSYKYYLTALGKDTIVATLFIKNEVIVPKLDMV